MGLFGRQTSRLTVTDVSVSSERWVCGWVGGKCCLKVGLMGRETEKGSTQGPAKERDRERERPIHW